MHLFKIRKKKEINTHTTSMTTRLFDLRLIALFHFIYWTCVFLMFCVMHFLICGSIFGVQWWAKTKLLITRFECRLFFYSSFTKEINYNSSFVFFFSSHFWLCWTVNKCFFFSWNHIVFFACDNFACPRKRSLLMLMFQCYLFFFIRFLYREQSKEGL